MITYDELEEQYFILTQKVKDLERKNNELELRLIEMETENEIMKRGARTAEDRREVVAKALTEETLKVVNLNVLLDEQKQKVKEAQGLAEVSRFQVERIKENSIIQLLDNAEKVQTKFHPNEDMLMRHSVHRPMERMAFDQPRDHIILRAVDTMSYASVMDPLSFMPSMHVFTNFDGKTIRYAQKSILEEGPEDFAVVIKQMTRDLAEHLCKAYIDKRGGWV